MSRKTKKPFLVINGPSAGAGKDEVIRGLDPQKFRRVKTVTTREIVRDDEKGNDPYVRMNKDKFKEQAEAGAFVEWIELADNYYGTRKAEVEEAMLWEETPVLRMDPRGAWRLATMCREGTPPFDRVNLIAVMILPPDHETLERRLLARDGGDSNSPDFKKRMRAVDEYELSLLPEMHFAVINYEGMQLEASGAVETIVNKYL
jgi:guanylate kinase